MHISQPVRDLEHELIALRRDIHAHPELGLKEFRTAKLVADTMRDLGLEVEYLTETGVVGLLRGGKPGKTLLLRADMDALPIQEQTGLPFASTVPEVMHACAHDGHTAMLLTAAKILSRSKEDLAGNIKFVFQPNEENIGAKAMIDHGLLQNPDVDACMGQHLWCPLPYGQIGLSAGPVMAGMEHFTITVNGKGGHTAAPETTIDPVLCAADIILSVQAIQTREINVFTPVIIMFGQIQGGTASNVVPDQVTLSGTMRYLCDDSPGSEADPKGRFERVVTNVCRTHRASCDLSFDYGHPTLINNPDLVGLVRSVTSACNLEPEQLVSMISLAGEDFSEFAARVPSVFYFIGAGNRTNACYPHHHPCFDIDERALLIGVEIHVRTAQAFLQP